MPVHDRALLLVRHPFDVERTATVAVFLVLNLSIDSNYVNVMHSQAKNCN